MTRVERGPRSAVSAQHYQRPCQTENRHCDKYHSVGWHVRQKLDHLPAPLQSRRRQKKNTAIASTFQREDREKGSVAICSTKLNEEMRVTRAALKRDPA